MNTRSLRKATWEAARASLLTTVSLVDLGKFLEEPGIENTEDATRVLRQLLEHVVDRRVEESRALAPVTAALSGIYSLESNKDQLPLPFQGAN